MRILDKTGSLLFESVEADIRNFEDLSLGNAIFAKQTLQGYSFEGSDLRGSDFSGADLYWANLSGANCDDCLFVDADLRGVIFDGASFIGASFRGANLSLDNLLGSVSLGGIDLSHSIFDNTNLVGARYDDQTLFPKGFDPLKNGMQRLIA